MDKIQILVTGVSGLVGGLIYRHLAGFPEKYDLFALDRTRLPSLRTPEGWQLPIPPERFHCVDLSDFSQLCEAVQGAGIVVHMAGAADPASDWEAIHACNVVGAYHLFEACRLARVRRVIYASSLKVVHGYMAEEPYLAIQEGRFGELPARIPLVTPDMPFRPTDTYSASKAWGEGLARLYADIHGLSCLCLRFGWVNAADSPRDTENLTLWVSQQDMLRSVDACLEAPGTLRFACLFAVSESKYRWVDIETGCRLTGYRPQDWAEDFLEK